MLSDTDAIAEEIPAEIPVDTAEEHTAGNSFVSDDELAALLAMMDEEADELPTGSEEPAQADTADFSEDTADLAEEEEEAVPVLTETSADAISDAELEAMLAMIEGESAADDTEPTDAASVQTEDDAASADLLSDDEAFDDSLFDEFAALTSDAEDAVPYDGTAVGDTADDSGSDPADMADDGDMLLSETADDAQSTDAENFPVGTLFLLFWDYFCISRTGV